MTVDPTTDERLTQEGRERALPPEERRRLEVSRELDRLVNEERQAHLDAGGSEADFDAAATRRELIRKRSERGATAARRSQQRFTKGAW